MNAVVRLQPGSTCSRDRDVQPYRALRDRCRSDFGPVRWPHNDVHVTTGDGVQLAVRDYDPTSRTQTVVFLHGFCLLVLRGSAKSITYYGVTARAPGSPTTTAVTAARAPLPWHLSDRSARC
jgi:hypothetical protein